jgi:hypothetical protein
MLAAPLTALEDDCIAGLEWARGFAAGSQVVLEVEVLKAR